MKWSKKVILIAATSLCGVMTLWSVLALSGCSDSNQQEVIPILESDSAAMLAVAGTYEWIEGYYTLGGTDATFNPIELENVPVHGASIIYTFNLGGTFNIQFNTMGYEFSRESRDRYEARRYVTVFRGTFAAERIALDDIDEDDRRYMKFVDARANTSWYRIVMNNENGLPSMPQELEMFVSRVDDNDLIFYWPIRSGAPEAETSFVKRTERGLEIDFELAGVVAGVYFDEKGYASSDGNFVPLHDRLRKVYTFNSDATFRVDAVEPAGVLYEGVFEVENVALSDIDENSKLLMPDIDERGDVGLYRIVLHDLSNQGQIRRFELFLSHLSDDDIIIYSPDFESSRTRRISGDADIFIYDFKQAVTVSRER